MEFYIVKIAEDRVYKGETTILLPFSAHTSYLRARRHIEGFSLEWKEPVQLVRKVTPVKVLKMLHIIDGCLPVAVATFRGVTTRSSVFFFSIYRVNVRVP